MEVELEGKEGRLEKIGDRMSELSLKYMPDAFIYALLLTFLTWILAMLLTPKTPAEILLDWGEHFWGVLKFSMQSSYGLMLCTVLAVSPIFRTALRRIAAIPKTHFQIQLLNVIVATLLMLFHWGMLVAAGIFARELALASKAKGLRVHYPLLVAGAYAGLLPWHLGLSGASQLLIATKGHFLEKEIGVIPVSQTLFHPYSLGACIILSIITVLTIIYMTPRAEEKIEDPPKELLETLEEEKILPKAGGVVERILENRAIVVILGLILLMAIFYDMIGKGRGWDLNAFIAVLYGAGLLIHKSLRTFFEGMWDAVRAASQIFLQFQFYGGIMGIMAWTGLAKVIAFGFASVANRYTWPILNFIQASIINLFVPSGGGQFTVTAHIMIEASRLIGTPIAPTMMTTFAMGDQWTNMIQPFWAIPVIAVAAVSVRKIMGYCAVVLITTGIATLLWIAIMTPLLGVM